MKLAWHVKCYDPSQTLQREGHCPDLPDAFVEEQIGLAAKNSFLAHFADARIAHEVPLPCRSLRRAAPVLVHRFTGHLTIWREEWPSGIFVLNRGTHLPHTHNSIIGHRQRQLRYNYRVWHKAYLNISNIVTPMKRATVFNHAIECIQHLILSRLHHQWFL